METGIEGTKIVSNEGEQEDAGEKTDKELQKTLKCHED